MYFTNENHKKNYHFLMKLYNLRPKDDTQCESSIYIAAIPDIYQCFDKRLDTSRSPLYLLTEYNQNTFVRKFIHPALTGSTTKLCEFGLSLYNGYGIRLDTVFNFISKEDYIKTLIQAIKIRTKSDF